MWAWIKSNVFQSITIWIWIVLVAGSTIVLFLGKIDGNAWLTAQPIFAGIALAKRAFTQATGGSTE